MNVSVINSTSRSQRFQIVPPSTAVFSILYEKSGSLAPGMSQKITVCFNPSEYKYYFDCIRIHCDNDDLQIPIHGYPVVNDIKFPRWLTFGSVPLCEPAFRVCPMLKSVCLSRHLLYSTHR